MPKQLVCQNREEESAVGSTSCRAGKDQHKISSSFSPQQQPQQKPSTDNTNKPSHRLGSFAFQPYQLFNPTPYAGKKNTHGDGVASAVDDVISNGSSHSTKSYDSKELPINLMGAHNVNIDRMVITTDELVNALPKSNPLSPTSVASISGTSTVQKLSCQPTTLVQPTRIALSRSSSTTHLGSTPPSNDNFHPNNSTVTMGCIKLPPTSMYPYNPTTATAGTSSIISPTGIQLLPPLPSISSMRSLVGLSPKVQKQGFASPKIKAKKGLTSPKPNLSAHLTTSNFSAVVNSGSTKSFGSTISTTQSFYASPMKSVDNNNPYTISSSLNNTSTVTNENVNHTNIMNNVTTTNNPNYAEKKEVPVKPIPKLPFGTLSLMN